MIESTAQPPPRRQGEPAIGAPGGPDTGLVTELADYLWGSPQPPALLFRTSGFAFSSAGARAPAPDSPESGAETGAPLPPPGILHLYSRFMVFATTAAGSVGRAMPWGLTPAPLGRRAFARLSTEDQARLRAPLNGPDTVIVRLEDVDDVRSGRWLGAACIELHARERLVRLGAHPALAGPQRAQLSAASTRWEPRLYTLLRELTATPGSPDPA